MLLGTVAWNAKHAGREVPRIHLLHSLDFCINVSQKVTNILFDDMQMRPESKQTFGEYSDLVTHQVETQITPKKHKHVPVAEGLKSEAVFGAQYTKKNTCQLNIISNESISVRKYARARSLFEIPLSRSKRRSMPPRFAHFA